MLLIVAVLSGLAFTLINAAFFVGQRIRVAPAFTACFMLAAGALYFLFRSDRPPLQGALLLYGLAPVTVACCVANMLLLQHAIRKGALASAWISQNLAFVPQALFCALVYQEPFGPAQQVGLILGIGCLTALSLGQRQSAAVAEPVEASAAGDATGKILLLLLLLITNSVFLITTKVLSKTPYDAGATLLDRGGDFFYLLFYGGSALLLPVFALRKVPVREQFCGALFTGLLAGTGSVLGLILATFCVAKGLSGTVLFPVISIVSITMGSLVAVLFFREKPTAYFVAGNLLAVAAVVVFVI